MHLTANCQTQILIISDKNGVFANLSYAPSPKNTKRTIAEIARAVHDYFLFEQNEISQ